MAKSSTPRSRPGGRSADISARVTDAVLSLLVEDGAEGCTVPRVAERAGVQRTTLYRRYADRWAMIIGALTARAEATVPAASSGRFADDLRAILTRVAEAMDSRLGAAVMIVAATLRNRPDRDEATRFWRTRLAQLDPLFDAAIERGELARDVDREELFAFAAGPVHFRLFVTQQPVDEAWIEAIVEAILGRYARAPDHAALGDRPPPA